MSIKKILIIVFIILSLGLIFKYVRNTFHNSDELFKATQNNQQKVYLAKVEIKGNIKNPGTYEVPLWTELTSVIEKAGGIPKNSNQFSDSNLYIPIFDGQTIIINNDGTFFLTRDSD